LGDEGVEAAAEQGHTRLTVYPFWTPAYEVELPGLVRTGHGGADGRMMTTLLGPPAPPDSLGRAATARDGAFALLPGLAANASIARGGPVAVADLIDPHLLEPLVRTGAP